jgi:hypothetical protein
MKRALALTVTFLLAATGLAAADVSAGYRPPRQPPQPRTQPPPVPSPGIPALWYRYEVEFEGTELGPKPKAPGEHMSETTWSWTLRSDDAFLLSRLRGGDGRFDDGDYAGNGRLTYRHTSKAEAYEQDGVSCSKHEDRNVTTTTIFFTASINSASTAHDGVTIWVVRPPRTDWPVHALKFTDSGQTCTKSGVTSVADGFTEYAPGFGAQIFGTLALLGFRDNPGLGMPVQELLRFRIPKARFGYDFTVSKAASFRQWDGSRRSYSYTLAFRACPNKGRDATTC